MTRRYSNGRPGRTFPWLGFVCAVAVIAMIGAGIAWISKPSPAGFSVKAIEVSPGVIVKDYGIIQSISGCRVQMQPQFRGKDVPVAYICDVQTDLVRMQGVDITKLPGVDMHALRNDYAGKRLTLKWERAPEKKMVKSVCLDDECRVMSVNSTVLVDLLSNLPASDGSELLGMSAAAAAANAAAVSSGR
jgi:hypothetical protein